MRLCFRRAMAVSMFLALLGMPALGQSAMGTDFTYQGKLRRNGAAVNGTADFQLRLYDAATGGAQIGAAQSLSNVSVADGLFNARIDFGADAFNGDARYLEVAARTPAGSGNFVVLTPRQALTAAPYALKVRGVDGYSLDGANGGPADAVYVDNAGSVGMGTTAPQGRLDVRSGNGSYVLVDSINGDLHMNGGTDTVAGLYNDSTGPGARLDLIVNNWPQMVVTGAGRVGIGTVNPISPLDVRGDWGPLIRSECNNSYAIVAQTAGSGSTALSAHASSPTGQAVGVSASSFSENGAGLRALATNGSGVNYGVWASSASSSGYDFYAAGAGVNYGAASSRRWKHNVELIADPLAKLARIRGVYFDWDAEHGGHHDVGMIAEEVGAVLPEIVAFEANGVDASGMDYSKLTPLLVEVAKAQQGEIEELRRANAELGTLVAGQARELAEMREQIANLAKQMAAMERR